MHEGLHDFATDDGSFNKYAKLKFYMLADENVELSIEIGVIL